MPDPRFFQSSGPFRLGELAGIGGGRLAEPADEGLQIGNIAPLQDAGPGDLTFFDNRKYLDAFRDTAAAACVVAEKDAARARAGMPLILSETPYKTFALIAQAFYPRPAIEPARHESAVIAPSAVIGEDCRIDPFAVIEAGAEIGAGTAIGAGTVIGRRVVVGRDCRIGAHVSLSHCLVGDRVTIHPGARIGQDGFGFAPDPAGHVRVPQIGRVVISDDVEIGANSTIDRGAGPDTVIGAGTWIDNLVQIGHNVRVGRGCILVAQSGVSGSTVLGDFVAAGGQVGFAGHLKIGAGAQLAAKAGVMSDVPAGETYCGAPAQPIRDFFREVAVLRRLAKKGTTK
ncbi:UDP-3-O-(3-hydroxymyristoyl)glucosamine N-acyltransferase [Oceanibacterium hippocampi]|uniref:UDP-3-O-acylglucosamine N-acyltransferase n=1 Tax=Oceanibacterium hippocampi TaxID=745714 RepID=A0A1Y5T2H7_9PROT|nr:UDP-3-O-(3-hydroxymyristoyl)glucosamine N-acyltransferase [Oceanibacterium hippocampi]SLN54093.1 UDP-3-O-acylglucosamine N-acyltransferase [Oceanibacterium hippocampi]